MEQGGEMIEERVLQVSVLGERQRELSDVCVWHGGRRFDCLEQVREMDTRVSWIEVGKGGSRL